MEHQAAPHASLSLLCGLHQFVSHTESTALLFESEWLLQPAFGFPPDPASPYPPPAHPPPIDSIREITGTEKNPSEKPAAFK